mgnify:FL=1
MKTTRIIRECISSFVYGIKNIVKLLPTIWNDRDYDEVFIYRLLLKKIENKIEFFSSDKTHVMDAPQVTKELIVVRDALKRLISDDWYYIESCRVFGLKAYQYEDFHERCHKYEDTLRKKDIEIVFSKRVASQIEGWWD